MRRFRVVAIGLLAAAAAVSSCGTVSKVTTAHAVSNAFANVGKQSGVSLKFSLGVTAAQIQQMDSTVPAQSAQAISTGAIYLAIQSGHGEALDSKQMNGDTNTSFDFGLQFGSSTPIEFRYVGQNIYVHADVSSLLSSVGVPTSAGDQFKSGLQQADQYVPGLAALGQGQWVEISHSALQPLIALFKQFSSSLGGTTSTTVKPNQSQIMAAVGKLRNDLLTAFKNNVTYKNAGSSNGRTHYQLILAVQPFVQQAGTALSNDLAALPGGSQASSEITKNLGQATAKIPAGQTAVVDLFVQDNKAQEIDVDLNQFAHKSPFAIPLRVEIGSSPNITAPSGATQLDLSKLPQLLSGLAGSLGGSAG